MNAFEYARPKTAAEAVRLLAEKPGRAAILAGGTDLLSLMKDGIESPARVVSLAAIAELRGVKRDADGTVRIGARTTVEDLLGDAGLAADFPALRHAAAGITSPQIRSMGTIGGDLCQRPRCWYYRAGFASSPGAATPLVERGDSRYHAILGGDGPAHFVHPSSFAPALVALGARAGVLGTRGARELAVADLFRTPKQAGERELTLGADEILTELKIPPGAAGARSATYEVRERKALDWPLVAAAVSLRVDGGMIRDARVVLGHVAPIPWMVSGAGAALEGAPAVSHAAETAAGRAGEAAVAGARPLAHNAYKIRLTQVAVRRAVLRALGREV